MITPTPTITTATIISVVGGASAGLSIMGGSVPGLEVAIVAIVISTARSPVRFCIAGGTALGLKVVSRDAQH